MLYTVLVVAASDLQRALLATLLRGNGFA